MEELVKQFDIWLEKHASTFAPSKFISEASWRKIALAAWIAAYAIGRNGNSYKCSVCGEEADGPFYCYEHQYEII